MHVHRCKRIRISVPARIIVALCEVFDVAMEEVDNQHYALESNLRLQRSTYAHDKIAVYPGLALVMRAGINMPKVVFSNESVESGLPTNNGGGRLWWKSGEEPPTFGTMWTISRPLSRTREPFPKRA
jgi:hypothetical protein